MADFAQIPEDFFLSLQADFVPPQFISSIQKDRMTYPNKQNRVVSIYCFVVRLMLLIQKNTAYFFIIIIFPSECNRLPLKTATDFRKLFDTKINYEIMGKKLSTAL